jgi:hypothetical protein
MMRLSDLHSSSFSCCRWPKESLSGIASDRPWAGTLSEYCGGGPTAASAVAGGGGALGAGPDQGPGVYITEPPLLNMRQGGSTTVARLFSEYTLGYNRVGSSGHEPK